LRDVEWLLAWRLEDLRCAVGDARDGSKYTTSFVRRRAAWSIGSSSICFMIAAQSQRQRPWASREGGTNVTMAFLPSMCLLLVSRCRKPKPPAPSRPLTLTSMHTVSASLSSLSVTSPLQRLSPLLPPPPSKEETTPVRGTPRDGLAAIRPRGPGDRVTRKIGGPSHTHTPACPALLGPARTM
jgi:hypothetical protein